MDKEKTVLNWSGGKDSSMALYKLLNLPAYKNLEVVYLLTTINEEFKRVSHHGVREKLLDMQSESIGIPLYKLFLPKAPDMETYNRLMDKTHEKLKEQNIFKSVFGDIFLEDLRKYRKEKLSEINVEALFPLWKIPSDKLVKEFIDSGFKAVIVAVNENYLDKSFAGREIDYEFLNSLPANADPCGENGEFHSFVYDGPVFSKPIRFEKGEIIKKVYSPSQDRKNREDKSNTKYDAVPETTFWFCDLLPQK